MRYPTCECRGADQAAAFGFGASNSVIERVAETVGRERVNHRAQRIRFVTDRFWTRRERALA